MTPLLSEQTQRTKAELEATGTSGSTIAKTTALGLLLLQSQPGPAAVVLPERRFVGTGTLGTSAEVRSLKVTELDLFRQMNRVYDELLRGQMDLDPDVRRVLYGDLWSLYS